MVLQQKQVCFNFYSAQLAGMSFLVCAEFVWQIQEQEAFDTLLDTIV